MTWTLRPPNALLMEKCKKTHIPVADPECARAGGVRPMLDPPLYTLVPFSLI